MKTHTTQVEKGRSYNKGKQFKKRNEKQREQVSVSDPIVDKIRLIKTFKQRDDMTDFIASLNREGQSFQVEGRVLKRGWYTAAYAFHLPSNDLHDPDATMWVGLNSYKKQVTLEYCPAKLSDRAYDLMDKDIFSMTRDGSFMKFIMDAKVKRLDVCRNIFNMKMSDFLFRASSLQKYGFYTGKNAEIETIYYGAKNESQYVFYDKKKQDKKSYRQYSHVVRVERKHISPNLFVRDLVNYKNPFLRAEIYEFAVCQLDSIPKLYRECFKFACWSVGVRNALDAIGLTEKERDKALLKIRNEPWPVWVQAQENWKAQWKEALEAYRLLDAAA